MSDELFASPRRQMVQEIALHATYAGPTTGRAALNEQVMEVMGKVPRHAFVPAPLRSVAYADTPLPIGCEKTISQPYIVALMTDLLEVQPDDVVLEIGTGLGYQAAVLAELVKHVYSIEIIEDLADEARKRLKHLGYTNVTTKLGDGCLGWPEHAPFDAIVVTAAPDLIPPALIGQLKPGARIVIPTGISLDAQQLTVVEKDSNGRSATKEILPVSFSPLATEAPTVLS
jgi:protein-L-isoaspartate(D-aspartate) O-methyltransferase